MGIWDEWMACCGLQLSQQQQVCPESITCTDEWRACCGLCWLSQQQQVCPENISGTGRLLHSPLNLLPQVDLLPTRLLLPPFPCPQSLGPHWGLHALTDPSLACPPLIEQERPGYNAEALPLCGDAALWSTEGSGAGSQSSGCGDGEINGLPCALRTRMWSCFEPQQCLTAESPLPTPFAYVCVCVCC